MLAVAKALRCVLARERVVEESRASLKQLMVLCFGALEPTTTRALALSMPLMLPHSQKEAVHYSFNDCTGMLDARLL